MQLIEALSTISSATASDMLCHRVAALHVLMAAEESSVPGFDQ